MDVAYDSYAKKEISAEQAIKEGYYYRHFTCGICGASVTLVRAYRQRPHFRHLPGQADINCDLYFSSSMGIGKPFIKSDNDKGLDLELSVDDLDWSLRVLLPEIEADIVRQFDTLIISRTVFSIDKSEKISGNLLWPGSGGQRVPVDPQAASYEIRVQGELPTGVLSQMESITPGLNTAGTVFSDSPAGCVRLWKGQGLYPGSTLYIIGKENKLVVPIKLWPKELIFKTLNQRNGWDAWEVLLPEQPSYIIEDWLSKFGHGMKLLHAQLRLVWPPPIKVSADGKLFVPKSNSIIWSVNSALNQPISPLLCHQLPNGLTDVEKLPDIRANETKYFSISGSELGVHQIYLSLVACPPFKLEITEVDSKYIDGFLEEFKCNLNITDLSNENPILQIDIPSINEMHLDFELDRIFGSKPQYELSLQGVFGCSVKLDFFKEGVKYVSKRYKTPTKLTALPGFVASDYLYITVDGFGSLKLHGKKIKHVTNVNVKRLKQVLDYIVANLYAKENYIPIPISIRKMLAEIQNGLYNSNSKEDVILRNLIRQLLIANKIPSNLYGYLIPFLKDA